jgi:yecA family protein
MNQAVSAFTYDELDELFRGKGGPDGYVGMSSIDGMIAALVAGPSFIHPEEWLPHIFGGKMPNGEPGTLETRAVQTIFNRYNEVSQILSERPEDYRPIFMIDNDGSLFVRHWVIGFMLGLGLRQDRWAETIFMTKHRSLMEPILLCSTDGPDFLFDMPPAVRARKKIDATAKIPGAVVALRNVCNPYRAAESRAAAKPNRSRRRKSSR